MFGKYPKDAKAGIPLIIPNAATMRYELFQELYDSMSTRYVLPPPHSLRLEELLQIQAGNRTVPVGNKDDYKRHVEEFEAVSKTHDLKKLGPAYKENLLNTRICPKLLYIRICTVLIGAGRPPLPMAGTYDDPQSHSSVWLLYCAKTLDPFNFTGACWKPIEASSAYGRYIHELSLVYSNISAVLLHEFGYDMTVPANYNDMMMLTNTGRVKAKGHFQDKRIYFREDRRQAILQGRETAYYSKLESMIMIHLPIYQAYQQSQKKKPLPDGAYITKMGEIFKILTENAITDLPIHESRIKLLAKFGVHLKVNIVEAYAESVGALMSYNIIDDFMLNSFHTGGTLLTEIYKIKEKRILEYGDKRAVFTNPQLKRNRMDLLRSIDDEPINEQELFQDFFLHGREEGRNNFGKKMEEEAPEEMDHLH